jgi:MFS family permease
MQQQSVSIEKAQSLGAKFFRLWQASSASNLADGIWLTAGPLLATTLTRDPLLVAGLVTAQRLPWFLFSLHSGALVDRWDRKKILWIGNAIRTLLIAALGAFTYLEMINIYGMYVFFFLLGIVEPFFDNASFAILPRVVTQPQLEKANGRLFASSTLANEFIGPPAGSFLFAIFPPLAFLVSALTYGGSSALMATLPGTYTSQKKEAGSTSRLVTEIMQGFRWFWGNRVIRALSILVTLQNMVATACISLLVLYAQDYLGLSEAGYGLLISVGALGGLLAGFTTERLAKPLGTGRSILLEVLLMGVGFIVIGTTRNVFITGAMLAFVSFSFVFGNTLILSLRQTIIPDDLLGRVTSVYRFIVLGTAPLGGLLGGLLARQYGLPAPYWMGGVATILATIAIYPFINNAAIKKAREDAKK